MQMDFIFFLSHSICVLWCDKFLVLPNNCGLLIVVVVHANWSVYFLHYWGNMVFILLWCFVVLTYYWSAGKVLAYTVNGGYVSPNYSVWWFWPYNLWLLMLSIVRSLSKLLFFLSLSSKHVHFQYCQCFVSWPEAEVFTMQFRLIWFKIVFGLSFPALAILRWYYNYNLGLDDTFFLWFEQPAS
jgi:hypothetical protein